MTNSNGTTQARAAAFEELWWLLPLFGCAVLIVLVSTRAMPGFRALMADDSFQYLSVASNIDHGMGLRTSIAHFDEERSWGVLPAPITTFPVGYPALIALLAASGLNSQTAALLVSVLATCAAVFLLDFMARRLALTIFWRALLIPTFIVNEITLQLTSYAVSEPLFTALTLAAMSLLIVGLQRQKSGRRWLALAVGAGLVIGASDWVRYAGLFPFVGVLAAGLLALVAGRRMVARPLAIACIVASGAIGAEMVRNVMLVGNWRGGNSKIVSRSPLEVAHLFGAAVRDIIIGNATWSHLLIARMLLALLVVGGGLFAIWRHTRAFIGRAAPRNDALQSVDLLLTVVAGTYIASILYVASRTMISLEARIFFPILPLALVLLAKLAYRVDKAPLFKSTPGLWRALCLGTFLLYAGVQVDAYYSSAAQPSYVAAQADLNSTTSDGMRARDVILQLTGTNRTLMATNGQALAYLTGAPTVSLVGPEFSARRWDEAYVRDTMRRFSVEALVVSHSDPHFDSRDFIGQLGAAHCPDWLIVSGITDRVVIYRTARPL